MLVLRLLVMVLTIICLMDGHAEVSSSTTGIRDRRESPAVKTNDSEVEVLDRKKKKKPKPSKKKKPKPGKKKPKPNKAKPKPAKPVTTTTTISTSTLKTTTILTTPTITTTATTTTTTVSPTTTVTTVKTTTSTVSATTTLSTTTSATTSATTTTVATSSTASITTTTIPTTATTSSPPTTAATTADSGAGGECKATNGKPCIFPFKDGNEDYNECKNEGGKYFWCATSVYDSGKYKHWSYCSTDGPCPLEGDDEECKATNNKPCVFPFKDGNKEYNECADHGGKYFWCATGTNSAGKYTAWSECPKDGSCPLPQKSTTPAMTSTETSAAPTTPLTTGTTAATDQMEEKVLDTLENLVLGESRDDSLQMAHILDKKLDTIIKELEGETSKTELSNSDDIPPQSGKLNLTIKSGQDDMVRDGTELGEGLMFVLSTVDSMKSVSRLSGDCCQDCTRKYPDTELAEYWATLDTCYCYKKMKIDGIDVEPKTRPSMEFTTKACDTTDDTCCETLMISSTEGTAEYQGARLGTYKKDGEHNNKPVYKQQGGSKILFFSDLAGFEWVVGSSLSSGGGLRSKPGEAPTCPSDAKQWEYYKPGTANTWIVDSTAGVDCEEGISDCRAATEADCPTEHTFLEGGFTTIPYDGMLDSSHDVNTKCACRHLCDVRPTECKAFLFKTCGDGLERRCILLNVDKPATTTSGRFKNHFALCRRDKLVMKSMVLQLEPDGTSNKKPGDLSNRNGELTYSTRQICNIQTYTVKTAKLLKIPKDEELDANKEQECADKCTGTEKCTGYTYDLKDGGVENEEATACDEGKKYVCSIYKIATGSFGRLLQYCEKVTLQQVQPVIIDPQPKPPKYEGYCPPDKTNLGPKCEDDACGPNSICCHYRPDNSKPEKKKCCYKPIIKGETCTVDCDYQEDSFLDKHICPDCAADPSPEKAWECSINRNKKGHIKDTNTVICQSRDTTFARLYFGKDPTNYCISSVNAVIFQCYGVFREVEKDKTYPYPESESVGYCTKMEKKNNCVYDFNSHLLWKHCTGLGSSEI